MKRVTSMAVALALIMALCIHLVPNAVLSASFEDFEYAVESDGTVTITGYTGDGGDVVIPETIDGKTVARIGDNAFAYCTVLTEVTIPNSVASIGEGAFWYCSSLTSVTIPDSVTSIGDAAFYQCISLQSVTISEGVTNIGQRMFVSCASLTAINVAAGNPNYASIAGVLYDKAQTTLIGFPAGKAGAFTIPDTVTHIGNEAFAGCESLTGVTIPGSVMSIGKNAFSWCSSLTSVTIPDSVTSISYYAFWDCTSLQSITIPNGMTSIDEGAFASCISLTSVTIPDSVTNINGYAFWDCTSLQSITIPNSVTSIGRGVFYGCTNLSSIYVHCGSYADTYFQQEGYGPYLVYIGDTLSNSLSPSSAYRVDGANGFLRNVQARTSVADILSHFASPSDLRIVDQDGAVLGAGNIAGTGAIIQLLDDSGGVIDALTIIVTGDATGDSKVNTLDIAALQKIMLQIDKPARTYLAALDCNGDGLYNTLDIGIIQKTMLGISSPTL